jgi:cytochrome P450
MAATSTSVIPGRKSRIVIDVIMEMQRKGFLDFFYDLWKESGDFLVLEIRDRKMYLAVHPDHVRHISITHRQKYDKLHSYDVVRKLLLGDGLVSSRGDLWRRQRRLMAPFFSPRGIQDYYPLMVQEGQTMIERWKFLAKTGESVEMSDEMARTAAAIILRAVFSSESDEDLVKMKNAVETMIGFTARYESNPLSPPLWLPTGKNRAYLSARRQVHTFIDRIIQKRKSLPEGQWPGDLLSKLMQAVDEETGEKMPDQLLRDECITLFFAGYETTARTLTFLWYSLSQNPAAFQRLQGEVDRVMGNSFPDLEDLKKMPYVLQAIKETLRLFPPAPFYVRDTVEADQLDGYSIPPNSAVLLSPYLTHRHLDFWEEPQRFDPDRWTPEQEEARHPFAWHPFAAGQRICIGNNFSLLESHLLVSLLAREFVPISLPGHKPKLAMAGTLTSLNGVPMVIKLR